MVNFYVKRIKNGLMNIDDVPSRWKDAVEEAMINQEIN